MNIVAECFNLLAEHASRYRKVYDDANMKFDGKDYWEKLKPELADIGSTVEIDVDNIKKLYKELTDHDAPETDEHIAEQIGLEEINPDDTMNEKHHFFIQLFRIPLYGSKTFTKLMQIALNIGQVSPYINTDEFAGEYAIFYNKHRMNMIDTYLKNIVFHAGDIEKIEKFIKFMAEKDGEIMTKIDRDTENEITESSMYFNKYRKYKSKYLKLNISR